MKKSVYRVHAIALSMLLVPGMVMAQNFNNTYLFASDYERSAHTALYELSNGDVVQSGTEDNLVYPGVPAFQLGIADPNSGFLNSPPYFYYYKKLEHRSVDLIESLADPKWVVCASNMSDPSSVDMVNVFKADPYGGGLMWSVLFKSPYGDNQYANAITRDNNKNYYILGRAHYQGLPAMYLISIDDGGTVNWEQFYLTGNTNDFYNGVDLIFDGTDIVIVGNYFDPNPNGAVIFKIDVTTGSIIDGRNLLHLDGNKDFQIRDLEFINGEYVLTGQINHTPRIGFMVNYDNGLNITVARGYADPNGADVFTTGSEPSFSSDIYMSYDIAFQGASNPIPGILNVDNAGNFLVSAIYDVPGYQGSNGILGVNGFNQYMVKGSNDNGSWPGAPSMSIVSQKVPLAYDQSICNKIYKLKDPNIKYKSVPFKLKEKQDKTNHPFKLQVDKTKGLIFDCYGATIANFRLAPKAEEINTAATSTFDIYPNPSNGRISLTLGEEELERYREVEVYNMLGKRVASFMINNTTMALDLTGEHPGIYLVRMKSYDGNVSDTRHIIIH